MSSLFHPAVETWFRESFPEPTRAQALAWPSIVRGESTLLLAPTGSGKTLAAFLAAIDRLLFASESGYCRVLYVSPLKALAVDVERNLRAPIAGIARIASQRGDAFRLPEIAIRSGDTPARERARIAKHPPDILITTPESLYLLLTSQAREILKRVETVIVDEIHSVVSTKRGAHLFLSLERLEALREPGLPKLQRLGLSATQRPLEEVARALGGFDVDGERATPRPVTVVDAGSRPNIDVRIEVPIDDMSDLGTIDETVLTSGGASQGPTRKSIWPSIHPRLVELVRAHRSTMIFVNSRRLAERLANDLNETAGEELARAHHGSLARDQRVEIEERLKQGTLPAIVATSSLELGLDLGAVDLVIQIEAPPSVAAGLQRIGRASHHVGGTSTGIVFPKFRGDLLAAAAAVREMKEGRVEATAYPRRPLDVLAQQIVAIVAGAPTDVESVYALVRRAASYADLPRGAFLGVLDMLSGRYPSDELAELRPRVVWDRVTGALRARDGARYVAIINGGTIPDRGLYGVFLEGDGKARRVGELDEEMVLESREGDVFLLGASSWRITEITHDRVLVTPAPGEPGRMPFWKGDRPGRPVELGRQIGALTRTLAAEAVGKAQLRLQTELGLDERAAKNLVAYVHDQRAATTEVPSDRTIVLERFVDEIGDFRVCVLSPFGARVHAPWATIVRARLQAEHPGDVETLWSDDGMAFRLPERDEPPDPALFVPDPEDVERLLVGALPSTSLFAARFRECAARALLLPRRHPGKRAALWQQRKRAQDLLAVASRFPEFPIVLETYRECLRDVFDVPELVQLLTRLRSREIALHVVDSRLPSPFASSILFSWVASFLYDGDAPLAERRAQALSVDQAQLRQLLGEAELRELLDGDAIEEVVARLQRLAVPLSPSLPLSLNPSLSLPPNPSLSFPQTNPPGPLSHGERGTTPDDHEGRSVASSRAAKDLDGVHDLLRELGDLSLSEISTRVIAELDVTSSLVALTRERRVAEVSVGGEPRFIAVEDAARYRDALGIVPPRGTPASFLEPTEGALFSLVARWTRTHGPFRPLEVATRFGLGVDAVRAPLAKLLADGKLVEGELTPGGKGRELCDADVLRQIKRRSLAKLRREVEPVAPAAYARFLDAWQGLAEPRRGLDALLSVIEQLEGAAIPVSVLEREVLPARIAGYAPQMLDTLLAAGEIVWRGLAPLAPRDGRIALYLADHHAALAPPMGHAGGELAGKLRELLATRGAQFFSDLVRETATFPTDVLAALWDLVWAGEVTNDTFHPLRALVGGQKKERERGRPMFRSRRSGTPGTEGRWSLFSEPSLSPVPSSSAQTQRQLALVGSLLSRHGVLVREAVHAENIANGYMALYPVLRAMEERGRVRRGYFVAGLGASQFAVPGADDRLRALREPPDVPVVRVLAATDPANPWGAALRWPERALGARPSRSAGAHVVLRDGELLAWAGKSEQNLLAFLPDEDAEREAACAAIAAALAALVDDGRRRAVLIATVDGEKVERASAIGTALLAHGFTPTSRGFLKRRVQS